MSARRSIVIGGGAFAGLALALALRQGRDGHELAQDEGQAVRVVAVSDVKPSLLSFAAINGIPVKNYTDMAVPKPKAPSAPKPAEIPELVM